MFGTRDKIVYCKMKDYSITMPDHAPNNQPNSENEYITKQDINLYAPKLILLRHTGLLIMYSQKQFTYRSKPELLRSELINITVKNLLFGWWGVKSLFINPVVTIHNWVKFFNYKKEYYEFLNNPRGYIVEARNDNNATQ